LTQIVNRAGTALSLSSATNPSMIGQLVTLRATVRPSAGPPATGLVSFYDGSILLGSSALGDPKHPRTANQTGLNVQFFSTGTHFLVAVYNGSMNYSPSTSNTVAETVTKASTI